jgi:hypothetical protein
MKKLIWTLLLASAFGQNYTTVTASNIQNGSSGLLPSGTITFQAVGTNQQPISYQVGGGGQQILAPTVCPVSNGAILGVCSVANVLLTQPQNVCFNVTVKNSAGQVVLGGTNSGYQCVQPVSNGGWCVAGTCNFDAYQPNLPSPVLVINMPYPSPFTLGGVFANTCNVGSVVLGIGANGYPVCGLSTGVNQQGGCTMSAGTTCTFNIAPAFNNPPTCLVNVQGATAIAGACSVSGTVVTVTAFTTNSQQWGAVLFGNPN